MRIVVAIDPGIRSPGVAILIDGVVCGAAHVKVPSKLHRGELSERSRQVGKLISRAAHTLLLEFIGHAALGLAAGAVHVVFEWPRIRTRGKGKGDPNGLLKTLATGQAAVGELGGLVGSTSSPLPDEWARGTQKDTDGDPWASQRGAMVARRLSIAERAAVPSQHDAIDAVAIGLWYEKRFEPTIVNYGATPG